MGWSMENSLETADSMHCRGWGANRKRTTFRRNRFRTYDAFALGALTLLSVGAAAAAYTLMNGFGFFPSFHGSLGISRSLTKPPLNQSCQQNASPHNRTKTGVPLSGPFARKSKKDRLR